VSRPVPTFDAVRAARVLDQVATLVAAGIPAPRAKALASFDPERGSGAPAWDDVRAVLAVAERTGAPVAPTLRALAGALRRAASGDRAVRVALAGPRTSANVVLTLPVLGVVLGSLWGIDTASVLLRSPVGWVCGTSALLLVGVGRAWTARLIHAATPEGGVPGVLLDAWAVALAGGGSWTSAASAVRDAVAERPSRPVEAERLRETLDLARRAGVPAAALLRAAADDVRDDVAADALAAAERLGVRLVLPLGTCVLPAFVLVGVVPVVVGILSSTVPGVG
jgi:tight adherence protein B